MSKFLLIEVRSTYLYEADDEATPRDISDAVACGDIDLNRSGSAHALWHDADVREPNSKDLPSYLLLAGLSE